MRAPSRRARPRMITVSPSSRNVRVSPSGSASGSRPVSYTHLDVYKRQIAERARPDAAAAALLMLRTPALAIQSFTFVGIVAVSAAIVLWSIDLFRSGGAARAAGLAGGLAALVMLWTMALHVNHLNPQTLGFIVAAQAV